MAKTDKRARVAQKLTIPLALLLLLVGFAVTYAVSAAVLAPKTYDVNIGDMIAEDIRAQRDVTDEAATEAQRESVRNSVQPVYRIDDAAVAALYSSAEKFFSDIYDIRMQAAVLMEDSSGEALAEEKYRAMLTDEEAARLAAITTPALSADELFAALSAGASDIQYLSDIVLPKLNTALSGGLREETIESVRSACISELAAVTRITGGLKAIGEKVFSAYTGETSVVDEAATARLQGEAANAVEDVVIEKGGLIAAAGTELTENSYGLMRELGMIRDAGADVKLKVGVGVYLFITFALFAVYLLLSCRETLLELKNMLILLSQIIAAALLYWLCLMLDAHISPALLAIMLTAILTGEAAALGLTALLSLTVGLVAGGRGANMLSFDSAVMMAATLTSGVMAVFAVRKTERRGTIIAAGAVSAAAGALVMLGMYLAKGAVTREILSDTGWFLASAVVSSIVAVGSLSIWENIFDVATSARLNELLNSNQPLLKQLMMEAPGTYQHSMAVAALAEAAAQRIGANPLLARVGSVYHDVGKLRRPLYFGENQKSENIHDSLPPEESAASIIAHQRDGVTLLMKYKLPSAVVKIAAEHHGNSLVAYFYHKARQQEDGSQVNSKLYRYPGNRPSTKESAIVMLADSCEAAVRSLGDCTREAREEMIRKVIAGKMQTGENMLSNAPLTLSELSEIERSFNKTFGGIMHERIEYPESTAAQ